MSEHAQEESQTRPIPEIDPIWTSSRTARQIYDIARLLSLAASSISLLTLPQTDDPDDGLPQNEERSEQFVLEVSEYFERLDSIQSAVRSSLAHIRHSRIAPSAILAPQGDFVPPTLGVGLPTLGATVEARTLDGSGATSRMSRGLQEERIDRDAWKGILAALTRIKETQVTSREMSKDDTAQATFADVSIADLSQPSRAE
ncbi:hypothetical protein FISHEDRAFT_47489 [Fistulina hepatica ATCC 64428]|uniref:Mediator complex subunit 11 n=1 Tax=Fistulina hepatica ATCC 64428 TaxID=1128425 RepID=A0A0D7A7F5_9AGAR|nr:hypothetical protein FISHEDRAFT_47489 [Fistulina hepatica ATCC 64428]